MRSRTASSSSSAHPKRELYTAAGYFREIRCVCIQIAASLVAEVDDSVSHLMRIVCGLGFAALCAAACTQGVVSAQSSDMALPPLDQQVSIDAGTPPSPSIDPIAPPRDLRVDKSMIHASA